MAASAGQLVGSLIVVETVFDIPGLGGTVYDAIPARDQPVIMGVLIIVSVVVLFATLAADVVAAWLDPRLRKE
jgi:peptide/nickel transport system permease protein